MELELDQVGTASVERERELSLDQRLDSAALIDRRRELHDGVVLSIEHGPGIELLGSAQVARLVRHDVGGLDGARNCRQSTVTDRANICRYRGPEQLEVTQAVVLGDRRVHGSARSVRHLLKHRDSLLKQVAPLARSLEDVRQWMGCVRATHGAFDAIRCIDRSREISSTHEREVDARHSLAVEALASDRAREHKLPLDRLILVDENPLALAARASRLGLRWLELLGILDACRVSSDRDVAMEGRALVGRGASRVVALSDGNHRLGEAWCRASRAPHEERVGGEHVLRDGGQVVRDQWQWLEARALPVAWRHCRSGSCISSRNDLQHGAGVRDQLMILHLSALAQDGLLCHRQADIGMICDEDLELAEGRVWVAELDRIGVGSVAHIAEVQVWQRPLISMAGGGRSGRTDITQLRDWRCHYGERTVRERAASTEGEEGVLRDDTSRSSVGHINRTPQ